jgi:hypothetical protein
MKRLLKAAVLLIALLVTTACPENTSPPPQGPCSDGYVWHEETQTCVYFGG